jgi:hypothetical protein
MRIKFLLPGCLAILIFSAAANAQTDFNNFWTKFKAAVVSGNKSDVANLTKFPLAMPFGVKSIRSKADFVRRYSNIMNMEANAKRCFQNAAPEKQGNRYEIYCTFKTEPESSDNRPILDNINE